MSAPHESVTGTGSNVKPVTYFGPDFPFAYDDWLKHPAGLGHVPAERHGTEVAIVGAGMAGITAAHELMKLGLKPVVYESGRFGGRLRSQPFEGAEGVIAELGGMRFPVSSTAFYHYVNGMGLSTNPFPNPLDEATPSTVIDLEGVSTYVEKAADLPPFFKEVAAAWSEALEDYAQFGAIQEAIRNRDVKAVKEIWNRLVPLWDDRTFYDFLATAPSFANKSFRHLEAFGQVGFGTGGWDTDFPNSMLEILRVVITNCDEHQRYVVGGVEQVPRRLWRDEPEKLVHWPAGTSLAKLHSGATRPGVTRLKRLGADRFSITDRWGHVRDYSAVLVTGQSWLLTTHMETDESLFSHKLWMALDRTRYMQSSKTFVMVDRPFWKERDPKTGRYPFSMTLTDRLSRGTYLFDNGPDKPATICLSYSWMSDALKMLPLPVDKRVKLILGALRKIYPDLDIEKHIIGDPITVSWETDPNFLGAFKGALPGHYRYNHRMYCHFMQDDLPPSERGIFLAGDDVGWTPGWVEGAVTTALNAVWGIVHHLGGVTATDNPGPGDRFDDLKPLALPE
ncbi:flavin monoamine oxidase family protein [Methylovirgula sp. 4M-Z18]|uniref:flavin monoamine oxidase family protein n=1 Tax=Methylovirgula sp. 4M-Z18 TaxID=2293567 RepID=UPI000E2F454D|nr:NAD(P)/FAD-dependent oxidoreductase [Methylovirgula sp. 4M-Z18]RFB81241.1 FAD-dependent oxidoreductase [Methylovirgula sp. 4M-Z18]